MININGFKIFISHMPVSQVPPELLAEQSIINWRNILWPLNWPLPFLPGPEATTKSAMKKNIHPIGVDLVLYHHVHVAAQYQDPVTGTFVVSPGSASRNKSAPDQKTASFLVIDTNERKVSWHDISDNGKKFWELHLDSKLRQSLGCRVAARRLSRHIPNPPHFPLPNLAH